MKTLLLICFGLILFSNCNSDLPRNDFRSNSNSIPALIGNPIRYYNCMNYIDSMPMDSVFLGLFKQFKPQLDILYTNTDGYSYYEDLYFDSLWMSHEFKRSSKFIASENIGIIMACDQLCRQNKNSNSGKDSIFVLINKNEIVYDYKRGESNEYLLKNDSKEIEDLYQHFFGWMSEVRKRGFQYMIKQNLSPLPQRFELRKMRIYPG
ncbi:MAG TPA: hypothetical protein VGF79_12200 [Bacteroidia bacterium]